MNNKQFILVIIWLSVASAIIGYQVGGIVIGFVFMVLNAVVFMMIGD